MSPDPEHCGVKMQELVERGRTTNASFPRCCNSFHDSMDEGIRAKHRIGVLTRRLVPFLTATWKIIFGIAVWLLWNCMLSFHNELTPGKSAYGKEWGGGHGISLMFVCHGSIIIVTSSSRQVGTGQDYSRQTDRQAKITMPKQTFQIVHI